MKFLLLLCACALIGVAIAEGLRSCRGDIQTEVGQRMARAEPTP